MGNENVIEFNGKRYDAITGELLGKSHAKVVEPLAPPRVNRRTIDGVVRKKPAHEHAQDSFEKTKVISAPAKTRTKPAHPASDPLKPHRPEPAKTLMRRAVHKPTTTIKPAIKLQSPAEVMAKPISAIAVKHSVHHVDPLRKHRAGKTPKSQAVRRFAAESAHPHISLPVHPQPAAEPVVVRPQTNHHTKPDIFEAALARANSHEQPALKHPNRKHHKRRKMAMMITGFVTLLTLGGMLAYLNMSAIELKVASMNAGFSAQLPSYNPTGYELTDIKNKPGQVTLQFRSGDRNYQLTQQPTDWNSQTLGDSIIADASSQPIQVKGRIVYVYEGIASWVSGGVRYDITGNADFDANELAAIVGSM